MGQFAVQLKNAQSEVAPSLRLVQGGKRITAAARSLPTDIIVLGLILTSLQILDGILTGIGMSQYGTGMEGNLLLRSLMTAIGYIPALVLVKGASIALITLLCQQAPKISWLKPAFYGVIALYVMGAVVPWTYILIADYLA
jgi:hypothetical protein